MIITGVLHDLLFIKVLECFCGQNKFIMSNRSSNLDKRVGDEWPLGGLLKSVCKLAQISVRLWVIFGDFCQFTKAITIIEVLTSF